MGKSKVSVAPGGGLAEVLLALRLAAQGEYNTIEMSAVAAKILNDHLVALALDNKKAVLGGVKPKDHYLVYYVSYELSPKEKLLTVVKELPGDWREGDILWDTANRDVASRKKWTIGKRLSHQTLGTEDGDYHIETWKIRPEENG